MIVAARALTKTYRVGKTDVPAVRGVDLEVAQGEFVAFMGPSGSGKSTLLQLLGGLDRPTSGEVFLEGIALGKLNDDALTRLRRERTGFVFQFFNLLPTLTLEENIALPFLVAGHDPHSNGVRGSIASVIELLDLTGKERHRPDELSGGEHQRAAIARALVTHPAVVFADEPTGNLDYASGTEVLQYLHESCRSLGQTIVLVTHDAKAAAYADRVLFVRDGAVLEEIALGRRETHDAKPLIDRLAELGL